MGVLCKSCDVKRPASEFYEKSGRTCKRCAIARARVNTERNKVSRKKYAQRYYGSKAYKAAWKRRKAIKREWIKSQKSAPCVDCGRKFPPECMDFDHRDRRRKSFSIASAVSSTRTIESIKKEIAKCDLVCANCHRIRTARQMEWS